MFPELSKKEFELFSKLVYDNIGITLGEAKKELVKSRLGKRLRVLNIPSFKEYYKFVTEEDKEEIIHLFDAISTNKTSFFREKVHFDLLHSTVLPKLIEQKAEEGDKEVRIWCAAASTGEEPYTLAITLSEFLQNSTGWGVKILGTDISTKVLDIAERGIYPTESLNGLDKKLISNAFLKGEGEQHGFVKVKPALRKMVTFKRFNLLNEHYPFKKKFDFVFCRNVMIYFDKGTQSGIVSRIYDNLRSDGYLFIGHAETLMGIDVPFKYIQPTVYYKEG